MIAAAVAKTVMARVEDRGLAAWGIVSATVQLMIISWV
jgi:hypothetical protein